MKIKRYVAPDIRQAIRMVREEQGPDAVILSNKRIDEGVEIIAAVDYDEGVIAKSAQSSTDLHKYSKPTHESKVAQHAETPSLYGENGELPIDIPQLKLTTPVVEDEPNELLQVQNEIKTLRSLVENQLSGLAWADMQLRKPVRAKLLRRLMGLGLTAELCKRIVNEMDINASEENAWRGALESLAKKIPVTSDNQFSAGSIITLIGASGAGKTTTIAKIAARFALNHDPRQIVLVATDNYRIGGQEQLKVYSRILSIPMQILSEPSELEDVVKNASPEQLILIDTPAALIRQTAPKQQFSFLSKLSMKIKNYLVLPATSQRSDLEELVDAFADMHVQGCILTKLDETTSLGGVLSVMAKHHLPIAYVSEGQRVPEDLHLAKTSNLVSKCVTLSRHNNHELPDDELAVEFGETTENVSIG